eukprot:scaffold29698_cov21-Tisochrysis_lutea.AAC.3
MGAHLHAKVSCFLDVGGKAVVWVLNEQRDLQGGQGSVQKKRHLSMTSPCYFSGAFPFSDYRTHTESFCTPKNNIPALNPAPPQYLFCYVMHIPAGQSATVASKVRDVRLHTAPACEDMQDTVQNLHHGVPLQQLFLSPSTPCSTRHEYSGMEQWHEAPLKQ